GLPARGRARDRLRRSGHRVPRCLRPERRASARQSPHDRTENPMKTRLLALGVALGLFAAIVATAQARAPKSAAVTLKKTSLGTILVDPRGRALYLFEKDGKGISAC